MGSRQSSTSGSSQTEGDSGGRTPQLIIPCHFLVDEAPIDKSENTISCPGPKILHTGEYVSFVGGLRHGLVVAVYQRTCPLPEALVGSPAVGVYQLVENLGCALAVQHLSACMWVPFPFCMPLLAPLAVFRNT